MQGEHMEGLESPGPPLNRQVPRAPSSQEKGHEGWDQPLEKKCATSLGQGQQGASGQQQRPGHEATQCPMPQHTECSFSSLMEHPNNHAGR